MDDPKWKPGWLEWSLMIAAVVLIVILALVTYWPPSTYHPGTDALWLHLVGP